jgi:hypothetical protein
MTDQGAGSGATVVGDKGLKKDAIGFVDALVIGLASTAPAYSLAAVIGLVVLDAGVQAPAVLLASFVPMFFIAAAFYYMNRAGQACQGSSTGPHLHQAEQAFGGPRPPRPETEVRFRVEADQHHRRYSRREGRRWSAGRGRNPGSRRCAGRRRRRWRTGSEG